MPPTDVERLAVIENTLGALADRFAHLEKKIDGWMKEDHDKLTRLESRVSTAMWIGGILLGAVAGAVVTLAIHAGA